MRCIACDYLLKDLTERRCPECRRGFDPNDPSTFHFGHWRLRLLTKIVVVSVVFSVAYWTVIFVLLSVVIFLSARQ